jgi:uncharacterized membrane protein YoaK (UPF0700 family)
MTVPPRTIAAHVGAKLALMSFASGCMDILSYQQLGQVFTSAMTGNAALFGLSLGQSNVAAASRNIAAFVSFLIGLGLGAVVLRRHRGQAGWSHAVARVLILEEALLLAFVAAWHFGWGPAAEGMSQGGMPPGGITESMLYGLIAISAVAMGAQSAAAHRIGAPGITTTYFTGTLTNIVIDAVVGRPAMAAGTQGAQSGARRVQWPMVAFLAYVAGATLTGFLLLALSPAFLPGVAPAIAMGLAAALPALPAVAIGIVLIIALLDEMSGARNAKQA